MKKPILSAFIAFVVTANAFPKDATQGESKMEKRPAGAKIRLTDQQRCYLDTYSKYRIIAVRHFKLADDVSLEELRPHLAKWLNLSTGAAWTQFQSAPSWFMRNMVVPEMTEERRERFSRTLCGRRDATWVDLLMKLEEFRLLRTKGEIGYRRPGWSPFF